MWVLYVAKETHLLFGGLLLLQPSSRLKTRGPCLGALLALLHLRCLAPTTCTWAWDMQQLLPSMCHVQGRAAGCPLWAFIGSVL